MTVYIYSLSDPHSGLVRYVGKTYDPEKRIASHMRDRKICHKTNWIRSLGAAPKLTILETIENSNDEDWQQSERDWIAYLKSLGCPLTNLDGGGNRGKRLSIETRLKMKARTRSPESRLAQSLKLKGRKRPQWVIEKIRAANIGAKRSGAARKSMSEAHKGKKLSPESIAKRTAKQKGLKRSLETRLKLSAALKGKTPTAETRLKISNTLKQRNRKPHDYIINRLENDRPGQMQESYTQERAGRNILRTGHVRDTQQSLWGICP